MHNLKKSPGPSNGIKSGKNLMFRFYSTEFDSSKCTHMQEKRRVNFDKLQWDGRSHKSGLNVAAYNLIENFAPSRRIDSICDAKIFATNKLLCIKKKAFRSRRLQPRYAASHLDGYVIHSSSTCDAFSHFFIRSCPHVLQRFPLCADDNAKIYDEYYYNINRGKMFAAS